MKKILISVPCFNEEENIKICLDYLLNLKKKITDYSVEILVVNDGSRDSTQKTLKTFKDEIIVLNSMVNCGLSEVFNTIMNFTANNDYDYVVIYDADNQYPANDIPMLLQNSIDNKSDIHIGARDFKKTIHFSKTKNLLQVLGSSIVSKILGIKIKDVTSGFRIYSKRATNSLFSNNSFTYTIETLFQGVSVGLIINSSTIGEISKTRDSRLFKSNFDYIKKSIAIIVKSFFLYRLQTAILLITALFLTPGIIVLSRFFTPYFINGSNPGNVQSLIIGTGYITILIIFLFYILIRIDTFKKHSELRKLIYKSKHI
jgi:glycosyltransferase involved in cell wall biosynthesis